MILPRKTKNDARNQEGCSTADACSTCTCTYTKHSSWLLVPRNLLLIYAHLSVYRVERPKLNRGRQPLHQPVGLSTAAPTGLSDI